MLIKKYINLKKKKNYIYIFKKNCCCCEGTKHVAGVRRRRLHHNLLYHWPSFISEGGRSAVQHPRRRLRDERHQADHTRRKQEWPGTVEDHQQARLTMILFVCTTQWSWKSGFSITFLITQRKVNKYSAEL